MFIQITRGFGGGEEIFQQYAGNQGLTGIHLICILTGFDLMCYFHVIQYDMISKRL